MEAPPTKETTKSTTRSCSNMKLHTSRFKLGPSTKMWPKKREPSALLNTKIKAKKETTMMCNSRVLMVPILK